MIRTALISAAAASLAAAAIASAQTPPATLHLVSTARPGGFFAKHIKPGARFGFVSAVSGGEHGTSRALCTDVGGEALLCTLQLNLAKGTITGQGMLPQKAHDVPLAITGGTGAYAGARGTALATDTSARRTSIDITLR